MFLSDSESTYLPLEDKQNIKLRILQSDGCGEYIGTEFQIYVSSKEIHSRRSFPFTPLRNRNAVRMNRALPEMSNNAKRKNTPKEFWVDAVVTIGKWTENLYAVRSGLCSLAMAQTEILVSGRKLVKDYYFQFAVSAVELIYGS